MEIIKRCNITEYNLDKKNSTEGRRATRLDPAEEPEIAIDITEIIVELKTSELKSLKVGTDIEFVIDEELTFSVPDYRTKEYRDVDYYCRGTGSAEIVESIDFEPNENDDEYQEVTIKVDGYAEQL